MCSRRKRNRQLLCSALLKESMEVLEERRAGRERRKKSAQI
jgi:hypothetical protein